jgi:hypothetical protein
MIRDLPRVDRIRPPRKRRRHGAVILLTLLSLSGGVAWVLARAPSGPEVTVIRAETVGTIPVGIPAPLIAPMAPAVLIQPRTAALVDPDQAVMAKPAEARPGPSVRVPPRSLPRIVRHTVIPRVSPKVNQSRITRKPLEERPNSLSLPSSLLPF